MTGNFPAPSVHRLWRLQGPQNVSGLLEVLDRHDDLEATLEEWGATQVALGDRLLALGEQMEQAFIWNPLDLADADAATTEAWWRKAVEFPEEFSYETKATCPPSSVRNNERRECRHRVVTALWALGLAALRRPVVGDTAVGLTGLGGLAEEIDGVGYDLDASSPLVYCPGGADGISRVRLRLGRRCRSRSRS